MQVHEQSARLEKTSEAVRTAKVELRTKRGIGEGESTTEELEIDLQDVNHRNDVMLQQLGDVLKTAPTDLLPTIEDLIQQAGLVVPQ